MSLQDFPIPSLQFADYSTNIVSASLPQSPTLPRSATIKSSKLG